MMRPIKTIGFCTHFSDTCEWAFDYAFRLAQNHDLKLNICRWLDSPYLIRRNQVYTNDAHRTVSHVTPELLARLELQLRQYYDPRLGDYLNVGFKLCEGFYQVELARCLHREEIDLVVMGCRGPQVRVPGEKPPDEFARLLGHPMIIVGCEGPDSYLLNREAAALLDFLELPAGKWKVLEG
jgi:hypothetical protein